MIEIARGLWEDLVARAHAAAPLEACGILAGRGARVERIYPMTNADRSAEHFSLIPEEQFAVARDVRRRGLEMLALYHSHPATPPRMSEEDLRLAFTPGIAYVIVSLADPRDPSIASFRIEDGRPTPEEVRIAGDPPGTFRVPDNIRGDTARYRRFVEDHLAGKLSPERLRPLRVPMGIYEQRQPGRFMIRVRMPGGEATPRILRDLAALGRAHGSGRLHLTTRQDVQIHDVPIERTPDLLDALLARGLSPRGGGGNTVRNVTACPLAGFCAKEVFDVSPHVASTTEHFLADPSSFELPRKFKVCFSGCEEDCAWSLVADLGFVACARDGQRGFRVYAAGGMGNHSRASMLLEEFVPEGEFLAVGEAMKRLFERHGDRMNRQKARLRFVLERVGPERFAELYREEREKTGRIPPSFAPVARPSDGVPSPAGGSSDGEPEKTPPADRPRTRGMPRVEWPDLEAPAFGAWRAEAAIEQKQPGRWAARVPVPLGDLSAEEAEAIAAAMDAAGAPWARVTHEQDLVIGGMREPALRALYEALGRIRAALLETRTLLDPIACAGASTCRLGLCLSRRLARAIVERVGKEPIRSPGLRSLQIRASGCPNACGQHPIGDIGLNGVARRIGGRLIPFYRVFAGVRRGPARRELARPLREIPARAVPEALAAFLRAADAEIGPDEPFANYLDRGGLERLDEILAGRARAPSYEEDPLFYRDWGVEEEFSLAGRGPGECGAGLLDLVRVDLAEARKGIEEAQGAGGDEGDRALYRAVTSACRALLELRGMEPASDRALFRAFEEEFIGPGWFARARRPILDAALDWRLGDRAGLADLAEGIEGFVARAEALFRSLGPALQFTLGKEEGGEEGSGARTEPSARGPAEGPGESDAPGPAASATRIDLRGVACPLNFARAKIAMEAVPPGGVLEILLDGGEPVENVPASFRGEGQEVLAVEPVEDHFLVRVRRRRA